MTPVMTCTDCLTLVATADVTELTTATAVTEHCRGCADCASVVGEVIEEEHRLADLLDGTVPGVPAHVVALRAVAGAARGRRRAERWRTTAVAVGVTAASLLGLMLLRVVPAGAGSVEVRTVELQCLAPELAAELVGPRLPPRVDLSFRPSVQLPVLTLRGPRGDLAVAEQLVEQLDARWGAERSAYCAVAPNAGAASAGAASAAAPTTNGPTEAAPATNEPGASAPAAAPAPARVTPR